MNTIIVQITAAQAERNRVAAAVINRHHEIAEWVSGLDDPWLAEFMTHEERSRWRALGIAVEEMQRHLP